MKKSFFDKVLKSQKGLPIKKNKLLKLRFGYINQLIVKPSFVRIKRSASQTIWLDCQEAGHKQAMNLSPNVPLMLGNRSPGEFQ